MPIACSPTHVPPSAWERRWIACFLLVALGFGVHVEVRCCFLRRHQTDLDVYLRAAWTVRAGEDLYDVTDDNSWHYQYPPLFAILMTPFADPPEGADRTGYLPLPVSAAAWYLLSLVCLAFAVHRLAGVLEEGSSDPDVRRLPVGCRRWWQLRLWPVLVCVLPIGQTLVRGQVSLLLLACLAATAAALYRRQDWRAGFWLAAAICLKVIPAFLLIIPLWQRNLRCLAGCVGGLVVGMVLVPVAVFGLPRTLEYYAAYDAKVLRPGMGKDRDVSRAEELTRVTSTDSQSIVAMIHNTLYPDRTQRPLDATRTVRGIHWLIGGLLALVPLAAAGPRPVRGVIPLVLFTGALTFNMLILSPVCHLHYYCLTLPLIIALMARKWEDGGPRLSGPLVALFGIYLLTGLLPAIAEEVDRAVSGCWEESDYEAVLWRNGLPPLVLVRDVGLATYGAALLWIASCFTIKAMRSDVANRSAETRSVREAA